MGAEKSLYWHFLRIIVPLIAIVFIVLIVLYEWVNFNADKDELILKLDSLTSTYSLLLAEPVATNNTKDLQLYNISLTADPDVAFVVIKDSKGEILENMAN